MSSIGALYNHIKSLVKQFTYDKSEIDAKFIRFEELPVDYTQLQDMAQRYFGRDMDNAYLLEYLRDVLNLDIEYNTVYMIPDSNKIQELTDNDEFIEKAVHFYILYDGTSSPAAKEWLEEL